MQIFYATGNLANDPELKKTNNDISVCTFRLAVQRDYRNANGVREADFFNVVAWRGVADLCARWLSKGKKVGILGKINNRSYNAQDGTKRFTTEVVAEQVEFLFPRGEAAQNGPENATDGSEQAADTSNFTEITDDDLPF